MCIEVVSYVHTSVVDISSFSSHLCMTTVNLTAGQKTLCKIMLFDWQLCSQVCPVFLFSNHETHFI